MEVLKYSSTADMVYLNRYDIPIAYLVWQCVWFCLWIECCAMRGHTNAWAADAFWYTDSKHRYPSDIANITRCSLKEPKQKIYPTFMLDLAVEHMSIKAFSNKLLGYILLRVNSYWPDWSQKCIWLYSLFAMLCNELIRNWKEAKWSNNCGTCSDKKY